MNSKTIAKLAFVCLGVLALIDAVMLLASLLSTLAVAPREDYNRPLMISAAAMPFLILMSLSIYLISRSSVLSMKHFSEVQRTTVVVPETELQRLVFACLGIFILISSIPGICSFVALIASLKRTEDLDFFTKIRLGGYVGHVVQFGVGTYLIVRVRGWRLLKKAAVDKATSSVPQSLCPNCGNPLSLHDYNMEAKVKLCSACGHSLPERLFEFT